MSIATTREQQALQGSRGHLPPQVDASALAGELQRAVKGEVRFDSGSRALYARDASNYRQVPIGVVIPRDEEDVMAAVDACRRFGAPILGRGGGTSLAGQCVNVAVVLDFSKFMHHIIEINRDEKWARVQPGTILDHLLKQTSKHHLAFGPDPATHNHCTFGGMIGNNSCGIHSVMAGKEFARTSDNVHELEILTYDGARMRVGATSEDELEQIIRSGGRRGEIYRRLRDLRDRYADRIRARFPDIPRRVSGYNLDELLPEKGFHVARALVGTEATCTLTLEAKVRLIHNPPCRALLVLGYPDVYAAGDHVPEIMRHGPVGLEGLDDKLVAYNRRKGMHSQALEELPSGRGWLLAEFGGDTQDEANDRAEAAAAAIRREQQPPSIKIYTEPEEQAVVWEARESGLGATAFVPGEHDTWPGWEDSAVPPDRVGDYLRDLRKLYDKYGYDAALYGHFGQGCVHTRIDFELRTAKGLATYRAFAQEAADIVVNRYGGSISGEHGDGQARGELLERMYGPELIEAFREFKSIWDPDWKMNPGKVVDAYRLDENLVLGAGYNPPRVQTHFSYPEDEGDFSHTTLRCVGIGKCRRTEGGTMCPSYMVTREEKHTTRGRARMLYEMLQGNVVTDGWASKQVHDALDLCLACKGCKGDCPVNVDMATYKAEFLAHYFEHHFRPRSAWSMGFVFWWARLASHVPHLVNFVGRAPVLHRLVKWVGGVAPSRRMPPFAGETFQEWFQRRGPRNLGRPDVILWPDTFNNHFHPEVAKAAVHVLEHAGFHVRAPQAALCCGRPLYDYGFLGKARNLLLEILEHLRPEIRRGVPLVGLEPSCLAVFRDELINLLPHDEDARRLHAQSFTLGAFLSQQEGYVPPKLHRKALVHAHCHHKAIMGLGGETDILDKMELDYEVLDSGCCGMAGSFGFEEDHYDVSVACGERVLLPAVRQAQDDALIIADGFSCQEQIEELTDRRGLHLAQVLQMALEEGERGSLLPRPETAYPALNNGRMRPTERALLIGAAALVGTFVAWSLRKKA